MEILKKSHSKINLLIHLVYILLILALGAGLNYFYSENKRLLRTNEQLEKGLTGERVAVFFIEPEEVDFKLKPFLFPVEPLKNKHIQALQILLEGPAPGSNLTKIFPPGTQVLNFSLKDGTAIVDLNQKVTELNVGSTLEALAVISIVNTLTKFPDVYRVKILIEGKEMESLAGHVDLSAELRYSDFGVDPVPEKYQ